MERPTDDLEQKPPAKKPRLEQKQVTLKSGGNNDNSSSSNNNPFLALKDEPFHHILGFLDWRDLNEFAQVSKKCQQARNNPTLDQTREVTIRFLSSQDIEPLDPFSRRKFSMEQVQRILRGLKDRLSKYNDHYTRLVIKDLDKIYFFPLSYEDNDKQTWDGILSLGLTDHGDHHASALKFFLKSFPKLREVDASGIKINHYYDKPFNKNIPMMSILRFENVTCYDQDDSVDYETYFTGHDLRNPSLQELYLDNTTFMCRPRQAQTRP